MVMCEKAGVRAATNTAANINNKTTSKERQRRGQKDTPRTKGSGHLQRLPANVTPPEADMKVRD